MISAASRTRGRTTTPPCPTPSCTGPRGTSAFTPLHGVGAMTALETLERQGFRVRPVEEQMKPDGQFPNVSLSPNPEVPASMDRAAALAQTLGADIVLATDPDADRIGAMVPDK